MISQEQLKKKLVPHLGFPALEGLLSLQCCLEFTWICDVWWYERRCPQQHSVFSAKSR